MNARRERHHHLAADDRHVAVLERLAQRLQARAGELRQLVEEEHAVVRERGLARLRRVRRRPRGRRPRSCGGASGTGARVARPDAPRRPAIDWMPRHLDRLLRAERRQDRRQAAREHRLARAGRALQEQVVAAGRGDLEAGDEAVVAADVREVVELLQRLGLEVGRRRRLGLAAQRAHQLLQRLDPDDLDVRHQRRLPRPAARHDEPRAARGGARPRRPRARRGSARTSPVSDSSPTTAHDSTAAASSWPEETSSATASGRSNAGPTLRR